MSIASITSELILETIIKELLLEGLPLDLSIIENRFIQATHGKDLSLPQFDLDLARVKPFEISSASKWNKTNTGLEQDMSVAYQNLFEVTNKSIDSFDRWRQEITIMESRLKNLDTRISDLLHNLTQPDVKYIADDFVDTSKIDLANSTVNVDLGSQTTNLNLSINQPTRLNLNHLKDTDCQFSMLTRNGLVSAAIATHGEVVNAFDDMDSYWQSRVTMRSNDYPVTGELKVKLPILNQISRIDIKLHASNTGATIQITPFLSIDGISYTQVNVSNLTVSTLDKSSWIFPATDTLYVKFLMTKVGYDHTDNGFFVYEFGAEDISFYKENYLTDTQVLISNLLSVSDIDNNLIPFSTAQLQVCERIPDNTNINYYVAAMSNFMSSVNWVAIDHVAKLNSTYPKVIHFGHQLATEVDDIFISYNPDPLATSWEINPNVDFTLIDYTSNDTGDTSSITSTDTRYYFGNSCDRILDTQILGDLIDNSIELFRNVGRKNTSTNNYLDEVRHIRAGWSFLEPYYLTTVEVTNTNGYLINFGDKALILDSKTVKGKVALSYGVHTLKIHKNNWVNIPGGLTTITSIKLNDPLFPFNHKHLIEGYGLEDVLNPYTGVEIFAELKMSQVSVSDFITSVQKDDYTRFALDIDNGAILDGTPSSIFVVKSDENKADFLDERFTLRFKLKKQLYNYIKFKAEFTTSDSGITPNLDGYKLRISTN